MNSNMLKTEQFDHLHLIYHFSVPLKIEIVAIKLNEIKVFEILFSKLCHLLQEGTDKSRLTVVKFF